jgi:predicted component of type VI protein secretion system
MCRDLMIGAYMETPAVDAWMNRWVAHFVATTERGEAEYPLLEARVTFQRNVDDYSAHKLILHLRPRLDGVALARPLRLVAQLSARWL